jgi:hypothetical protein
MRGGRQHDPGPFHPHRAARRAHRPRGRRAGEELTQRIPQVRTCVLPLTFSSGIFGPLYQRIALYK